MIDTGLQETKTRVLELPADFPPELLTVIYDICRGVPTQLSRESAGFMLQRGGEFGIMDPDRKPEPTFTTLVFASFNFFKHQLSTSTALSLLPELWEIGDPALLGIAYRLINSNWSVIAPNSAKLIANLEPDLLLDLMRHLRDSPQQTCGR